MLSSQNAVFLHQSALQKLFLIYRNGILVERLLSQGHNRAQHLQILSRGSLTDMENSLPNMTRFFHCWIFFYLGFEVLLDVCRHIRRVSWKVGLRLLFYLRAREMAQRRIASPNFISAILISLY